MKLTIEIKILNFYNFYSLYYYILIYQKKEIKWKIKNKIKNIT